MQLNYIPVYGLFVLLNVQLFSTYPITDGLTNSDIDVLKDLLHRLEEVVPKQNEAEPVPAAGGLSLDRVNMEEEAAEAVEEELQRRTRLDEAAIREFLSAKNLKNVRNDSTSRRSSSSGCFGRRMDRIGSMSSLGCNTVGKYSTKRR